MLCPIVCVCMYTYAHACMNAFIPYIQKCMHACMHAYSHTYMHTYIHAGVTTSVFGSRWIMYAYTRTNTYNTHEYSTIIGFRVVNHHDVYIPGDQRPSHRSCFDEEIITSQLPPPCRRTYLAANRHSDCGLQQQFHLRLLHEEGDGLMSICQKQS